MALVVALIAFVPPCLAEDGGSEIAPSPPDAVPTETPSETAPEQKVQTTEELAKESQNPIANMVAVPIRNTINFGASAAHNKIQNLTTFIPTIPMKVSKDWNIIFRTTIPVLYQPSLAAGSDAQYGVSDINFTAYVARAESRKLLWGLGPTLFLPTAMERTLGTGKWSGGPAVAMVASPGDWVFGFLMYNVWSFAGYGDRSSINQFLLQTFVNYNLPGGWYLTTAPFLSANWKAASADRWMVPAGGGIGKIVRAKRVTLDLQAQGFYYVKKPRSESEWSLLLQLKFLFPKTLLTYQESK